MSSKSRNVKKRPQIAVVTREIFHTALKMMVEYLAKTCNKDILRICMNSLNYKYAGLQDPLLSQYANGFSFKEHEKIWNNVTKDFNEILQPCIDIAFSVNQPRLEPESQPPLESLPLQPEQFHRRPIEVDPRIHETPEWINPMQIGLISRLPPNDVSTIPCEIVLPNDELFSIPEAWSDTCASRNILSKGLRKKLGLNSDKSRTIELDKIGTITRTLGTISGLGIKVGGKNGCIIEGDFDEIDEEGLLLILGVPWLDKARALPDISSRKCIIRYSDKEITVPLSVHKKK